MFFFLGFQFLTKRNPGKDGMSDLFRECKRAVEKCIKLCPRCHASVHGRGYWADLAFAFETYSLTCKVTGLKKEPYEFQLNYNVNSDILAYVKPAMHDVVYIDYIESESGSDSSDSSSSDSD